MQDITFVHDSFIIFQNPYICLMTMGWEKCKPSHSYSGIRDTYIIHFVKSGKGSLVLNDKVYQLKANDVFLVRPNQISQYTANEKDPWHYCYFSFAGVLAASFLEETVFKNNNSVFSLPEDNISELITEGLSDIRKSKAVDICAMEYLFKLLSRLVIEPVFVNNNQNTLVKQIEQYIKQNYMNDIHTNEIALAFNISRNHLFRIFKKAKGVSIKTYILNIRMQDAKKLLLTTDLPIMQISEMLGFRTYSAFFKMFKSVTGYTPKEYRAVGKHTNENDFVYKSSNGVYRIESESDSIDYKNEHDTKI